MESKLQLVTLFLLQLLVIRDGLSFGIRNDHLGKCIQLIPGKGRVALAECNPESELQKWDWQASSQSLISLKTKECLTAARAKEHEMVRLQVCREGENQGWSCSKKGHLTLQGQGLHLSTKQGSSKVFLSKERGKTSKWRTMHNGTMCAEAAKPPTWKHEGPTERVQQPTLTLQTTAFVPTMKAETAATNLSMKEPDPTVPSVPDVSTDTQRTEKPLISLDDGISWKVAMLVLSSLALLLGLTILSLNIHYNRKKKLLLVSKPYGAGNVRGPVAGNPDERAPLTQRPARGGSRHPPPSRSPSLQRGEILIEWKDGTVTPLFDSVG
ncbi:uncharacterized protein LOC117403565 [Acipenser ruthenus]|uniref:uncharacterized protein LOC117403565 n=1 Tax=Acipenser ruthenus TaxID=7906 RepID=UPI0027411D33|nr:uncharacterized protein LOC117403565 [Acipenser ruthenus]XP_033861663.3 uncharacterized protein LOC117403565 [Acipenser ruthenus]XP_058884060.1 uncharacterized protein LOC117403565 [Acipenser ruthenus]